MNTYTWNAEDYEKNSRAQQKWAMELIGKLSLAGSEQILDLGCGDGKVTAEIAALVPNGNVVGVDSSSEMIGLANERYSSSTHPNMKFEVMDAGDLSFCEDFDVVFSNAALHWVKDHRPVVKGVYRSLKAGGKILFQMGGKGNAREILSVIGEMLLSPRWQRYFEEFEFPYGFLGTDEYENILKDAGLVADRVELVRKTMEHDGRSGLKGWIRTTWLPYTERVPVELRGEFIGDLVNRYLEKVPVTPDGKALVDMVRIEVEARKPV